MSKAQTFNKQLKPGTIYRRSDLKQWSKSVDRELKTLTKAGTLQKVATGIYHYPKKNAFGNEPPEEGKLIEKFLKSNKFLVTSYNHFNELGLGTTHLYNQKIVYNHSRSGEYKLGNRKFVLKKKTSFPDHLTKEFIFIELVNNLKNLAEDQTRVLENIYKKVANMNTADLREALHQYGTPRTKKQTGTIVHWKNSFGRMS